MLGIQHPTGFANGTRPKTFILAYFILSLSIIDPDYALEMSKRLTRCKSICMAKLITTAIPKFLREG
jgi:hypothetical protein